MNINTFSKTLNKSYTAINSIVKGLSKPGWEILDAIISNFPDINPGWLMSGEGEMIKQAAPAIAPTSGPEAYLVEHLHTLEENFARLAAQLEAKDKQLEAAGRTVEGLQRTVDALISRPIAPAGNFLNDVAAGRSVTIMRVHPATQQLVETTGAVA